MQAGDRLIIDAHLDLGWNALSWKRDLRMALDQLNASEKGMSDRLGRARATVTLPEMRAAGVAVCLGTAIARVPYGGRGLHDDTLDFPCHHSAHAFGLAQLNYYRSLERAGEVRLLRTGLELEDHWQSWESQEEKNALPVGLVFVLEGCDAITAPEEAEFWYGEGLRCASLAHYGHSAYAVGTGQDGPVTTAGRKLLDEFARLGIILDVTHLSDTSFYDAVKCYDGPVLASHQNSRELVPGIRQFTEDQMKIVLERGGIVATSMDAWMLSPGWVRGEDEASTTSRSVVDLNAVVDQIDRVCQLAGNAWQSGFGTDLDGGFGTEQTPTGLDRIRDLQKIAALLDARGFSDDDIDGIFHGNLKRFLVKHLPVG